MILGIIPTQIAFAEDAAEPVTVYITVNDKGIIATDRNGNIMADKVVVAKDTDEDGKVTYLEAAKAAHKAYMSENDFFAAVGDGYTSVTKLWGISTYNCLFMNNSDLVNDMSQYIISDGDSLVFSINKDGYYYADWYSHFDISEKKVAVQESVELTLKGRLGMAYLPEDMDFVPLSGISVGEWKNGKFLPFENKKTDEDGKVTISFDKPGVYYITADGTVSDEVYSYIEQRNVTVDCPIIAPVCKVIVDENSIPKFENLQFMSSAIKDYDKVYSYSYDTYNYSFEFKNATTKNLTVQATTVYDTQKYTAIAEYTDANGTEQSIKINSGKITSLTDIPFEETNIKITISDNEDAGKKSVYSFKLTRPRDTKKTIKGITLIPDARELLKTKYRGFAEGTMFKLDEDGEYKLKTDGISYDTGVSSSHNSYKTILFGNTRKFALRAETGSAYAHIRYSTDKTNWTELPQGGGNTKFFDIANDESSLAITFQIADDASYLSNKADGKSGYENAQECGLIVEKTTQTPNSAEIKTAEVSVGDWYPTTIRNDIYSYVIAVTKATTESVLTFTVSEGATVKVGSAQQTATNGNYELKLKTSKQTVTVTSADGAIVNTYDFAMKKKSVGYPDKITDYLCINSQYTNGVNTGGNATTPWNSLAGTLTSLGNFGGYITYYYDEPITDNPNNKYGIDFYVYGNSNIDNTTGSGIGFFEPAQAWVSEDGKNWYALAGSAHYDDGVDWDYSVTYTKTPKGKTAWTDNHGNSNDGSSYSGQYPFASIYSMNNLSKSDTMTLSGIALPSSNGKIAVVGEAAYAYPVKWGYADCFENGQKGLDVNPYLDNSDFALKSNGFDLQWAVDKNGNPVNVDGKEFHYVKLVTASNIWTATAINEKSSEISGMLKTTPQEEAVGKTTAPKSIKITDGAETKIVKFEENKQIYSVNVGDMKYVSVSVDGASEDDNIYVNNTRIAYNSSADGFKVTAEKGEKLVRVVVQNGDKEPYICLLKMTGTATESSELIEGVKLDVSGSVRPVATTDGTNYSDSVGYRISSVGIHPVADSDVTVTINGEALLDEYTLNTGDNIFEIKGKKGDVEHTVTLKVTKASAPASNGKITVYFTLLGDEEHGDDGNVHTYRKGGLQTWISRTPISVDSPATVLDVLEKALDGKYSYTNAGGNYISEINGLSEFSNGNLSGWMYSKNGSHKTVGIAEESVKNGDSIIFHYTDDYTKEEGAQDFSGGINYSSSKKDDKKEETKNPEEENKTEIVCPFADVEKHWAYDAIMYVFEKELMKGVDEENFEPDEYMTRAMLVTVLYRMDGENIIEEKSGFSDVSEEMWYYDAVNWASENGIVAGVGEGIFAPDENVTREQMAVILHRYAKYKGYDVEKNCNLTKYSDNSDISEWAVDAFVWAVASGLINGTGEELTEPQALATRAQVATIIMRFGEMAAE